MADFPDPPSDERAAGFPEPPSDGPAAGFFGARFAAGFLVAFQAVSQTMQRVSDLLLFVSHWVQRQSEAGLAGDGRRAAGRGALSRGGAASGAGARREPPQIVQDPSDGSLKVSQSAQRQLARAATVVLPFPVA